MSTTEILVALALFAAGVLVAVLVMVLRERGNVGNRVTEFRDTYEPLFADLWSDEMHRRLAALFVAQRTAKSRASARGLGSVLISFIRRRLAGDGAPDSFDDVRLALSILSTGAVRQAQSENGQGLDLSGIDFRGAALGGVNLEGFRLSQSVFDRCRLAGAKLADADLSGASLVGTDLSGADLRRADLSDADLSEAVLTGARVNAANFTSTNIGGTILAGAQGLIQEQLDAAFGDNETAVPERMRFVPTTRARRD